MKLLAVNTSGFSASLAICQFQSANPAELAVHRPFDLHKPDLMFCREKSLTATQSTAECLVPAIAELLESAKCDVDQIDRFAVATGPGSFTGLRIGLTTVKTLSYATGSQVVGINSLAAIGQNARNHGHWTHGRLITVMNAFRKQLFVAMFDFDSFAQQFLEADSRTKVIGQNELADFALDQHAFLAGPGIECLSANERGKIMSSLIMNDLNSNARGIADLACLVPRLADDPITIVPHYFRGSAAEEKLKKQLTGDSPESR